MAEQTQTVQNGEPPQNGATGGTLPPNGAPENASSGAVGNQSSPAAPFATFPTKEAFEERVQRAVRSRLKSELGIDDPGALKQLIAEREELRKKEEERKAAEMTEAERHKTEAEKLRAQLLERENDVKAARFEAELIRLCAERGIRDVEYAKFKVNHKKSSLKPGDDFEEKSYLDELLTNPRERISLGVDTLPSTEDTTQSVTVGANSSPVSNPHAVPHPPVAGGGAPTKTAYDMDPNEWANYRRQHGIG